MSIFLTLERTKKILANFPMTLVCIMGITMLTAACSTAPTKQTASTDTAPNPLAVKEKSDNEMAANKQQELECRDVEVTGSRFKKKVCEYKETWAAIDKKNSEKTGDFVRRMDERSNIVNPEGKPASGGSGGKYNTATTPGF